MLTFLVVIGASFAIMASILTGMVSSTLYQQRTRQATRSLEQLASSAAPFLASAQMDGLSELLTAQTGELGGRLLAAERRTVSRLPNEPYETALLRLLLEGPSLDAPALRGLFPAGTRVISTSRQGEMLFVTLSYQLMNGYSDEPSNWRSDTAWAQEVPLRRRLAMQAIAATVTETRLPSRSLFSWSSAAKRRIPCGCGKNTIR